MNSPLSNLCVCSWEQLAYPGSKSSWWGTLLPALFVILFASQPCARAQQATANLSTNAQLAALELERTNAWQEVIKIVNRPVAAYARNPQFKVSIYSPGWFHEGANKPDFNTADVRQTQDLSFAKRKYVSSDLNPNLMLQGQDLEFNSATKYFYVDRSLPKRKLSEAEMLRINELYRIIGRCEHEMRRLQPPVLEDSGEQSMAEATEATPGLDSIRQIPRETRLLYGGIAIGALLVVVVGLRVFRKARS